MKYVLQYTDEALEDFDRLYDFLVDIDVDLAERASSTMRKAIEQLESFPFSCRKASPENTFLRELVIPFGSSGYVLLFEIEDDTVSILAVRHQREDDYR